MAVRTLFFFLLSGLFLLCGCNSQTKIVNSVSGRDANEIVVLLNSRGILAQKLPAAVSTVGGGSGEQLWDISVPGNRTTEALSILNQAGLPRVKGTSLLDLFGTQGLVPSDLQDKIRYQEGLSEQLATTIRKMDGIIDADVQISFPQDEESSTPLTASVYVKHQGMLDNPNGILVTKIKRLVASAVPGLSIDNVSVVADRAIFSDISLNPLEGGMDEHKNYISIWSVIVARDSVTRFRVIFYSFLIVLFLLASALAWVLWKFYPLIQQLGGFKVFLKPEPVERVLVEEAPVMETTEEEIEL